MDNKSRTEKEPEVVQLLTSFILPELLLTLLQLPLGDLFRVESLFMAAAVLLRSSAASLLLGLAQNLRADFDLHIG